MVGGGFGPPKASPTDLQSVPFDHSGTPPGIFISRRRGLNPRPADYKSAALPTELLRPDYPRSFERPPISLESIGQARADENIYPAIRLSSRIIAKSMMTCVCQLRPAPSGWSVFWPHPGTGNRLLAPPAAQPPASCHPHRYQEPGNSPIP